MTASATRATGQIDAARAPPQTQVDAKRRFAGDEREVRESAPWLGGSDL